MSANTETNGATRVVLAHGDPAVRKALRDLTIQGLGMQVVGEVGDAAALRDEVEAERPDLVIIAWKLVAADAVAALADLRGLWDAARFVVLGPRPDKGRAALAAGADAYISMVDAPNVVATTLKTQEPGGSS